MHFSVVFSLFAPISSHIYVGGQRHSMGIAWEVYCADVVVSAVVDELVVLLLLMLEGMGMKPRVRRTS